MIQENLRKTMKYIKTNSKTPYNQLIVDQINMILGHSKASVLFWTVSIKADLMTKFCMYPQEI